MGRELKRVPLDFAWPVDKVWEGFINPHYKECPRRCDGGYSASYKAVSKHLDSLMWSRAVESDPQVAAITTFLAGRAPRPPFGHDSTDAYIAVKKLGELAGLPDGWHTCQHCEGSGEDPATRAASEAWTSTEPPTGDGYQIWETVSEGSPITPVFATPEETARYAAAHPWGAGGGSYESWLKFINGPGWAPSMVMDANGIRTGADAAFSGKAV